MEFRGLEITLISGKDLKDVNLISKMDVYGVVSIEGDSHSYTTQKQKTQLDKNCGPNPRWDQTFKFTLPEDSLQNNRLTLNIHLISDRALGDKEIGEVHVPIKELLDHQYNNSSSSSSAAAAAAPTQQNLVSYSVRTPNGKSKGTLNFSFKFADSMQAPPTAAKDKNVSDEPVMAYPASSGSSVPAGYHQQAYPYQHPATAAAYPPPQAAYGGYPAQQQGYGYGYGYPPPPQQGYGYGYQPPPPPQQQYGYYGQVGQQKPKKNGNKKMALGLGAGLLGGLLVGDMISDVGDMAAYDAGFDDGFGF